MSKMPFGPRRAFEDKYGQTVGVDVDEGDADVEIHWYEDGEYVNSALAPNQADDLADQLHAAAAYIRYRGLEPHA